MAVFQGWFQVKKGRTLTVAWGVVILLPALYLIWGVAFHGFAEYQLARLNSYLSGKFNADRDQYSGKSGPLPCGEYVSAVFVQGKFLFAGILCPAGTDLKR